MTLIDRHRPRLGPATVFLALLTLWLGFFGSVAQAHVFKTSEAIVNFDRNATRFGFRLDLNLEAVLAGIDPELKDTNDSPNAPEYDRLRALPPAELEKVFDAFLPELLNGLRFELDGKPVTVSLTSQTFREIGDISVARDTTLQFKGDLVAGAKVFTFGWEKRFGKVSLRTIGARTRSLHIEIVEAGATSAPMVIDDLKSRTIWDMIGDFMKIGFQHIVPDGLDHILFVVGIFLLSIRLRPILTQVTAFTVAHTVTLGLGTAGWVNLPTGLVEPLIAASIAYVAVENIISPKLTRWRPMLVFGFGLLHGLGFAGYLRRFNIPEDDFLTGLLSFNVGVELGQLTVIAVCFLLVGIWFGNKPWYRARVVIPGSLVIAVIGTIWFFQRLPI